MTAWPSLPRAARSSGSAIPESRSPSAATSLAASVGIPRSLGGESSGRSPCTSTRRVTTERPKKRLMRSISSGARCCSSSAAVDVARSFKTPSRPSADGQVTAAQSAPMIVAHSALSRTRVPPPRLATIGAASFDTATPTARKPWWRSLSRAGAVRLSESVEMSRSDFVVPTSSIRTDALPPRGTPDSTALLAWYDRDRRDLPWRAPPGVRPDPYRIWLSEIMLQQTTVATVEPYFDRFVARWPDISALAAASLDEVLQLWQGLGYYARARNLHACARTVVERHGGAFPEKAEALRALPGIGDYAQALMDLGATICTPRRPRCVLCPWRSCCAAAASDRAEELPARGEKPKRPLRHGVAFWLTREDGAVLLRRRPEKGLLGGMTEIPSTPWRATPWSFAEALRPPLPWTGGRRCPAPCATASLTSCSSSRLWPASASPTESGARWNSSMIMRCRP